jgi:hypothetical protein
MDITYKSDRLRVLCNAKKELTKKFGAQAAEVILTRQAQMRAAANFWEFANLSPKPRCHELSKRKDKDLREILAVKITGSLRMLLEADCDPPPLNDFEKLIWNKICTVKILSIEDYHD